MFKELGRRCGDEIDTIFPWFKWFELFLALICANKIGSLVNSLFWVKIFKPISVFFFFLFWGFYSTLLATVFSDSDFTSFSLPSSDLSDRTTIITWLPSGGFSVSIFFSFLYLKESKIASVQHVTHYSIPLIILSWT